MKIHLVVFSLVRVFSFFMVSENFLNGWEKSSFCPEGVFQFCIVSTHRFKRKGFVCRTVLRLLLFEKINIKMPFEKVFRLSLKTIPKNPPPCHTNKAQIFYHLPIIQIQKVFLSPKNVTFLTEPIRKIPESVLCL